MSARRKYVGVAPAAAGRALQVGGVRLLTSRPKQSAAAAVASDVPRILPAALLLAATLAAPAHAAFGGANGKVAFQRNQSHGIDQIHVANADGTGRVQVTRPQHYMYGTDGFIQPSFSPDGTRVVALGQSGGSLWTVYANGARLKKLDAALTHTMGAEHPSWSPDGERIYFSLSEMPDPQQGPTYMGIHSVRASDGADLRRHTSGVDFDPVVSPDGTKLAFSRNVSGSDGQLLVADADGGNPVPIYSGATMEEYPSNLEWSPDSQWIAFDKKNNGIFAIPAAGGDVRTILPRCEDPGTGCTWDSHPAYSPDGRQIAFGRTIPRPVGEENTMTLHTVPADGLGSASVLFSGTTDSGPSWGVHSDAQLPEPEPDATSGKPNTGSGTSTTTTTTEVVTEDGVGVDARLLTLRGKRSLGAFLTRRGWQVPVGVSVAGTVTLRAYAGRKVVGGGRATVGRAGIALVRLKASRAGRRLGRGRKLRLQVKGVLRSANGQSTKLRPKRITLTR